MGKTDSQSRTGNDFEMGGDLKSNIKHVEVFSVEYKIQELADELILRLKASGEIKVTDDIQWSWNDNRVRIGWTRKNGTKCETSSSSQSQGG